MEIVQAALVVVFLVVVGQNLRVQAVVEGITSENDQQTPSLASGRASKPGCPACQAEAQGQTEPPSRPEPRRQGDGAV